MGAFPVGLMVVRLGAVPHAVALDCQPRSTWNRRYLTRRVGRGFFAMIPIFLDPSLVPPKGWYDVKTDVRVHRRCSHDASKMARVYPH